jgi:putative two-component system response regulator
MKTHPMLGAELLNGAKSQVMQLARGIALAHHEKWDGSGYPNGLKHEDIPIMARICTVSDVFDALISERPYKKPWTVDDALELIEKQAGKDFDPNLAQMFIGIEARVREILAEAPKMFSETGTA